MTGKQLKEFAAQIPDDCVVEIDLPKYLELLKYKSDPYSARREPLEEQWVPVQTADVRVVLYPPVVMAERAAHRLVGDSVVRR